MEKQEKGKKQKQEEKSKIVGTATESKKESCNDIDCPIHGALKVRGRFFEGKITKKFPRRVVIEFERMIYVRKYERYMKGKTKIHARLPECMEQEIKIGDIVQAKECRPLSKIIHFAVIKKIKEGEKER